MDKKSALAQRARNARLFETPGVARASYRDRLEAIPGDHVALSIRYGDASAYMLDGRVLNRLPKKESEDDSGVLVHTVHPFLSADMEGAAPLNKIVNGISIPCGVCLIVGGGGVGKTPLAWSLAAHSDKHDHQFEVVRVGEPLAGYTSEDKQAALELLEALDSYSDVVVDSIKDLLSSARGAALRSGLSRGALSVLSAWSSVACATGSTIYVPVNPSTDEPDVVEILAEAARSNATSTIVSRGSDQWEYFIRSGEGLPRRKGTFSVSFVNDWAEIKPVGVQAAVALRRGETNFSVNVDPDVWNSSMRRAIVNQPNQD